MLTDAMRTALNLVRSVAQLEQNPNVQIILAATEGALLTGDDGILAVKVQEVVNDILLPKAQKDRLLNKDRDN